MPSRRGIYVPDSELRKVFKDMNRIAKHYSDKSWRREAMAKGAGVVADAAKPRAAKADGVHYYYKNRKKGGRRPRGTATADRIKILPGNLRLSIQHLDKLKKTASAVIGPKIRQRLGNLKNLGRSETNSSGFYAWMSQRTYSGAEDFRRQVMEPALAQSKSKVIAIARSATAKHTEKIRNRLSVFR